MSIRRSIKHLIEEGHNPEKERIKWQNELRKQGATIGKNVYLYPDTSTVDNSTPWLINIGDNVCFSKYCTLLNHDFSVCVTRRKFGNVHGAIKPIYIGNNVFVGFSTIIMMGTTIGDNVIIGAGSIVKGNIPSGEVWAGNPCHFICKTEEYLSKREKYQLEEAVIIAKEYFKKFNKYPDESIWDELDYFPLWTKVTDYPKEFWNTFAQRDNPLILKTMEKCEPKFSSYNEFLEYVKNN